MDTPPPELNFSLAEIAKAILIGIGSITLWLVKKLGDKHITSMDQIIETQKEILTALNKQDLRIAILEDRAARAAKHLKLDDTD